MASRRNRYDMPISEAPGPDMISARGAQLGATMPARENGSYFAAIRDFAFAIDDYLGELGKPLRPYIPATGRLLVISTFLEDTYRLVTVWSEQVMFLRNSRGMPYLAAVAFLFLNIIAMLLGCYSIVSDRFLLYGVTGLMLVVATQGLAYGLLTDRQFFFRNLSLVGGLLLIISDKFSLNKRRLGLPGLPRLDDKDRSRYIQLAGRVLLIMQFFSHVARGRVTFTNICVNFIALVPCLCVAIGFKARLSASLLVTLLSVQNAMNNSYWSHSISKATRDYLRYEYFQTLSIVGGLILLANMGAGRLSIDEKKKIY